MSTTKTDDKKDEQEDCKFEPQDTWESVETFADKTTEEEQACVDWAYGRGWRGLRLYTTISLISLLLTLSSI